MHIVITIAQKIRKKAADANIVQIITAQLMA
jgi:hypothetical protein